MANIVKVVGIRPFDFVNDRGVRYSGNKYYVLLASGRPGMQGIEVADLSASTSLMSTWVTSDSFVPEVGDIAELVYSRYGRLDHFRALDFDVEGLDKLFDV